VTRLPPPDRGELSDSTERLLALASDADETPLLTVDPADVRAFHEARDITTRPAQDGSRGGTGTTIAGLSAPPSISKTLPVTHDDASLTR
jgi:hypothetical protein